MTQSPSLQSQPLVPVGPTIYAVASGKGGVGKTWFTISLAHLLAMQGKKVLVIDGDLGLANIDVQLGLSPQLDMAKLLKDMSPLSQGIIQYGPGQFDIIAGQSGSGSLEDIDSAKLTWLCEQIKTLRASYDYIFIDLGAGLGTIVTHLMTIVQDCLVVLTDEPTSITDAYAFIKVFHQRHPDQNFHLIVNQAQNIHYGEVTATSFQKVCTQFLQYTPSLLGVIHRDNQVKQAICAQASIVTNAPLNRCILDLNKIVKKLQSSI